MGKRIFAVIAVMVTAALCLGTMIGSGVGQVSLTETPAFSGYLLVTVETQSGTVTYETHNIVVNIGKARVTDFLRVGATSEPATNYISLSDTVTAPAADWEVLPAEITTAGLTRTDGAVTVIDATSFTVSHKFNATGDIACRCSGLHWEVSGSGNLWAAATFDETTLHAGDNITITWTVTHT